jgi:hypothetical protein
MRFGTSVQPIFITVDFISRRESGIALVPIAKNIKEKKRNGQR